jgi:hypothetical protein
MEESETRINSNSDFIKEHDKRMEQIYRKRVEQWDKVKR